MELEHHDTRSSKKSWMSSSTVRSEEDSISGISENYRSEGILPPGTAVIRRADTNRRTNVTTGLQISELHKKNTILKKAMREQIVTQHNSTQICSARPITSRGQGHRHNQDTRYFIGVLHSKIGELNKEIEKLHWDYKHAQQELNNCFAYEIKAKELAMEITNFQYILTDLNVAFDIINSDNSVEKVVLEAKELAERNDTEKERVEYLFGERKLKESFVDQIKKNKISDKINFECSQMKEKYNNLNNRLIQSSKAIQFWEEQMVQYNEMRSTSVIEKTPLANEIIKLEIKLLGLRRKWTENIHSFSCKPGEEQRKVLEKVKQDKTEISAMELSIDEVDKKANGVSDAIRKLEIQKNYESDENSDNDKEDDLKKLRPLEEEITNILAEIKVNLSCNPIMPDYINLQTNELEFQNFSDGSTSLPDKFLKLQNVVKKMDLMGFNIAQAYNNLNNKCDKLKDNLLEYKTNTKLNMLMKNHENELLIKKQHLQEEEKNNLEELDKALTFQKTLEQELSANEYHKEIIHLEEKHSDREHDITIKKQMLDELKLFANDLMKIRNKTLRLIETVNMHLIKITSHS